jgi:hypothetical protein
MLRSIVNHSNQAVHKCLAVDLLQLKAQRWLNTASIVIVARIGVVFQLHRERDKIGKLGKFNTGTQWG